MIYRNKTMFVVVVSAGLVMCLLFGVLRHFFNSKAPERRLKYEHSEKNPEIERKIRPLRNELQDTINYRRDPKDVFENNEEANDNYLFYTNKIPLNNLGKTYLRDIHSKWFEMYELLEAKHDYIQWLFPLGTLGMNMDSQPLQYHEYERLKYNKDFEKSLVKSFKLMLDFYGMKLNSEGEIERTDRYHDRYQNLLSRSHNLLRITRILKCLGYFGLNQYQESWLNFLIYEAFVTKKLEPLESSITRFWVHTIRNDERREDFIRRLEDLIRQNVLDSS